jgi:hypothetical protein
MATPGQDESSTKGIFESLDLSSVVFPSDALTIRMLRRLYPDQFDVGFGQGQESQPAFFFSRQSVDDIGGLLYCERQIAVSAFASARGVAPPTDVMDIIEIEDLREELGRRYTRLGIANGEHETIELVRGIEKQFSGLGLRLNSR